MRTRKIFVRPQGTTVADINVTPLVDVVLVLLIIFMVATPLSEKELGVQLPEVIEDPQPPDEPPPQDQAVVRVARDGHFTINGSPVSDEAYVSTVRRIMNSRITGDKVLFFMADNEARYERLVLALDGAMQAGAETLAMVGRTPPAP